MSAAVVAVLSDVPEVRAQAVFDYPGIPAHSGHVAWQAPSGGFHHHHFHSSVGDTTPFVDANEGHDIAHALAGGSYRSDIALNPADPHYEPDYDAMRFG